MNIGQKVIFFAGAIVMVLIALSLRDPYGFEDLQRNMKLMESCDDNAFEYLGDYYEKRGEEGRLREILDLQQKCRADRGLPRPTVVE